jgi:hypothetical protein
MSLWVSSEKAAAFWRVGIFYAIKYMTALLGLALRSQPSFVGSDS